SLNPLPRSRRRPENRPGPQRSQKGWLRMPRLPSGKFFLVDHTEDSPEASEQFTLSGPAGEVCLPVFTCEDLAEAFMGTLPGNDWEIFSVSRESLLELLGGLCKVGLTHVAVDPPSGHDGSGDPVFSVFLESLENDG